MIEPITAAALQDRVAELPALPQAVLEVLQVLRNDTLSAERCIHLIEQDPALAARTLRLANSAFYGVPGRVTRIADAVAMLGLRTVSGALAAAALTQVFRPEACPAYGYAAHWRHAVATALAARHLAPLAGLDAEEAFLAGLMHDFGCLVLATHFAPAAEAALELASRRDLPLNEAESELLGLDHAQVGTLLARHWHFPPSIADAIQGHHAPAAPGPADGLQLDALVHIANAVAHGLDLVGDEHEALPVLDPALWAALDLDEGAALQLFAGIEQGVHEICSALHL